MTRPFGFVACVVFAYGGFAQSDSRQLTATSPSVQAFSSGGSKARKFGVHEIVLTGNGSVTNPFDTAVTVTFTPGGAGRTAVTVDAFYDGGNTWRARAYVSTAGTWTWRSNSLTDPLLDGDSGRFVVLDSKLPGMLGPHSTNPRAWATDNGRWFCNVSDTAYRLFHALDAPLWREYIDDAASRGVTMMRVASLGGWGNTPGAYLDDNNYWRWNDPWDENADPQFSHFDLNKFLTTEERLLYSFNRYPDLYYQFILFGLKGYGDEGTGSWWAAIPEPARERTMRYMIARWAAFPNLIWLIVNDMYSDDDYPLNRAFAREVGRYFAAHDPWHHLIASGPNRFAGYPFGGPEDRDWTSYVYIEDVDAVGADEFTIRRLTDIPLHSWMGEDYYEQDQGRYIDPRFYFRWLLWSWLLAGGSANYGGRYGVIHPYSQTNRADLFWRGSDGTNYTAERLLGLDSARYIAAYFKRRNIDLGLFQPDDTLVEDLDGRGGILRPKLARRGGDEFLIYHPNSSYDDQAAKVDFGVTARVRLDLTAYTGVFKVSWMRALDGVTQNGGTAKGGRFVDLSAPWDGADVVLRLKRVKR